MAATADQITQMMGLMQQQINLLTNQQTQQPPAADQTHSAKKTRKPDRPVVNAAIDDREWALFKDTWSRYKTMIGVSSTTPEDVETIRMELRSTCSTEVNRMLFEFVGPDVLNACTEEQLLTHIKSVAVKVVHHEVHQVSFHAMSQEQGESITSYVARLKAKAFLCKFETQCGCNPATPVSYADNMVAQRLVAGLSNLEHQRKILSEAETLVTLHAKVKRLQLLETTEESASIMNNPAPLRNQTVPPSESSAAKSQYKQQQRSNTKPHPADNHNDEPCKGCGSSSHPGGKSLSRKNCPAFKVNCHNCGVKGHFAAVCKKSQAHSIEEDETLESLASAATVSFSFAATAENQDFRQSHLRKGKT